MACDSSRPRTVPRRVSEANNRGSRTRVHNGSLSRARVLYLYKYKRPARRRFNFLNRADQVPVGYASCTYIFNSYTLYCYYHNIIYIITTTTTYIQMYIFIYNINTRVRRNLNIKRQCVRRRNDTFIYIYT